MFLFFNKADNLSFCNLWQESFFQDIDMLQNHGIVSKIKYLIVLLVPFCVENAGNNSMPISFIQCVHT